MNSSSQTSENTVPTTTQNPDHIPASLKFLMNTIKNVITQPLSAENHPLWRTQVLKIFRANSYEDFLDGSNICPPKTIQDATGRSIPNPDYTEWMRVDQNLAASLYSVISTAILPYVLSVDHCSEIWSTLERRLQSTTRSRIIQLKHELHYLTMKDKNMSQYLLDIKSKVDALASAGAPLAVEDIIHYTLDGLPATYQAFKTAIRTNLQPLSLDDLYTLLCSEELNIAHETTRELHSLQLSGNTTALNATKGRGRGRSQYNRGRSSSSNKNQFNNNSRNNPSRNPVHCQICGKFGHSAVKCWHRHDDNYNSEQPNTALFSSPTPTTSNEWFLDSGASSHLTADPNQFSSASTYTGSNQVILGNGQQLPIHNTGKGILPTPQGKLLLSKMHLVPNLAFNLLSVYQLTTDNHCLITFSSNGYEIKDQRTNTLLLTGPCINGLYPCKAASISSTKSPSLAPVYPSDSGSLAPSSRPPLTSDHAAAS
ncbi:hypothetical protein KFK09_012572 [Dendrobium nobile]|uniref:Retrovirus-related Pol polyprotein from transposon TNT 1-94-like beta-barrel domain-containing protein n=1 Tax=Dendrobium nobile TaxID=94219 RepID=A0A8T3BL79_DENNO|nr:hypothetical protein KFK09_012572 [Dendrobium nobile]